MFRRWRLDSGTWELLEDGKSGEDDSFFLWKSGVSIDSEWYGKGMDGNDDKIDEVVGFCLTPLEHSPF